MERYGHLRNSGVIGYEIGPDSVTVQFQDGHVYLYTNQSAGSGNIQQMQNLARSGRGLNAFIDRVVKKLYASKVR
jgi:hypothetical protein